MYRIFQKMFKYCTPIGIQYIFDTNGWESPILHCLNPEIQGVDPVGWES